MSKEVAIVGYTRTPFGGYRGKLSHFNAIKLASIAGKSVLEKSNISPEHVDTLIYSTVFSIGCGQSPSRILGKQIGLSNKITSLVVEKTCGSGIKAVDAAIDRILAKRSDVSLVCGAESMSQIPHYYKTDPERRKLGSIKTNTCISSLNDPLIDDGLVCTETKKLMGVLSQEVADNYKITREEIDEYVSNTYQKAISSDFYKIELTPVIEEGEIILDRDEVLSRYDIEKLKKLKPCFSENGTLTAASSSAISDGAAAILLMSVEKAKELGLKILAKIRYVSEMNVSPELFSMASRYTIEDLIKKANIDPNSVSLFEIHEPFGCIPPILFKTLPYIRRENTNIDGGTISIGHPFGATGIRLIGGLALKLASRSNSTGIASVCIGGGSGMGVLLVTNDVSL